MSWPAAFYIERFDELWKKRWTLENWEKLDLNFWALLTLRLVQFQENLWLVYDSSMTSNLSNLGSFTLSVAPTCRIFIKLARSLHCVGIQFWALGQPFLPSGFPSISKAIRRTLAMDISHVLIMYSMYWHWQLLRVPNLPVTYHTFMSQCRKRVALRRSRPHSSRQVIELQPSPHERDLQGCTAGPTSHNQPTPHSS